MTVRQRFSLACSLCACAAAIVVAIAARGIADRYDGLVTDDYLGEVAVVAKVEADTVFTEGPC